MMQTSENIGRIVKATRKRLKIKQSDLALASGTGIRLISDIENGKSTCQIGKVLHVLQTLGIRLELIPPDR